MDHELGLTFIKITPIITGMTTSTFEQKFEHALIESFSHLRDLSVRDGVQAWYANQIPIHNILPIVSEIDKLASIVNHRGARYGVTYPPVEVWGGGQVAQPAKFLYEDPLINLEQIHEAAPHLDLQCLYRGRQCFGFIPVSREVQETAIKAAADRGVKVFRIFDMMNDISNVETGINAIKEYREHTGKPLVIEGAISYISEPKEGGKRAWEISDYAAYAVKLADKGCDEIVIKNYAGVGDEEMPALIAEIRKKLDAAGYQDMRINLHTHGQKAQVLIDAIEADPMHTVKVDVAFGKLGNGPSHTNIMEVLPLLIQRSLRKQGVEIPGEHIEAMLENHEIGRQIKKIEQTIETQLTKHEGKRPPEKSRELLERYRMAGGALADPWNRLNNPMKDNGGNLIAIADSTRNALNDALEAIGEKPIQPDVTTITGYQNDVLRWLGKVRQRKMSLSDIPTQKDYYQMILEECPALWEKAGRFNTVTPGAKILVDQAMPAAWKKVAGEPLVMTDYDNEYVNVVTGRFGENKGMEHLPEAAKFRDAILMFKALKALDDFATKGKEKGGIGTAEAEHLIYAIGLGQPKERAVAKRNTRMIDLAHPTLEGVLMKTDINAFKEACRASRLPEPVRERLLAELTPGKSPEPTEGLDVGRAIVARLHEETGVNLAAAHADGKRISDPETAALLAIMLRERKQGKPSDGLANTLFTTIATGKPVARPAAAPAPSITRESGVTSRQAL
jgi:pyruvate/oxaloacetate carboxyltransferase